MVTGGGRGIGEALCRKFASYGAAVGILDVNGDNALQVEKSILGAGGQALAIKCDITDEDAVAGAVASLEKRFGKVDILVNNAAVFRGGAVDEMSLEDWHVPIKVILDGTFLCCKHVLPGMKARRYGKIVSICSAAVTHPFLTYGCYAAAKAGLIGLNNTMQEEVRPFGINTNVIMLGLTNTEDVRQRATLPEEEMLQPEDVAHAITFLCSDEGRGFKGAALEFFGDHV
ncbi:MAG: SDR family NAD(P)-dependent oxidoreductase [Lachnospiraceae bacterium]|nr:SDR family NAD(P)-dependent oxidoreductase [Lachnospiraceae bacterium]